MKRSTSITITILLLIFLTTACMHTGPDVILSHENQLPIIGIGGRHNPHEDIGHAPFEWEFWGAGYDPDGEIVSWVLRINGDTFRLQTDPEDNERSVPVRYQFPGKGEYKISLTAFDDSGGRSEFMPGGTGMIKVER